jgi:protein-tyrosine phosphatase
MPDGYEIFKILFVCHANLCRSPLAEFLARQAIDDSFGALGSAVHVASAGTHAFSKSEMHHGSAQALTERGIDPRGFTSQLLTQTVLSSADLVLTAGREQRAACVTLAPSAIRRTFTLRQFVRYADAVPGEPQLVHGPPAQRLRRQVERAVAVRHLVPAVAAREDDIADPVGQPIEAFRVCADEIERSVSTVVDIIAPAWHLSDDSGPHTLR